MSDRAHPASELQDIARRLEVAMEIQAILRGDTAASPVAALASRRTSVSRERTASRRPEPAATVHQPTSRPSAGAPEPAAVVTHPWQNDPAGYNSLEELQEVYGSCLRCDLGKTRNKFVFGVGSPNAKIMLIGEAPGQNEDRQGEPFVGEAGQLLNKILAAIDFQREDVYIANILKCRPPNNRDPQPTEIASCEPILRRQIEIIRPVVLCTLGAFAARTMLGVTSGISRLRGRVHDYRGIPLVPTYHPAALLRNASWKKPTWEDVQLLRREYDRLSPTESS